MSDLVTLMIEIAHRAYEAGEMSREEFIGVLERAINARAVENGYAERFGMPFPEAKLS